MTTLQRLPDRLRRILASGSLMTFWVLLIALAVGAILLILTGHDPVLAYREWIDRAILGQRGWQETIVKATPLLFAGGAVLLALRAGVWNIGIDGQVLVGALASAVVASEINTSNRLVMWIAASLAGMLAGAAWAIIPALLRGRLGVNEIVTTIMFNYIAISATAWLVKGPIGDPEVVVPQTKLIPIDMRLPTFGETRVHLGLVFAVVIVLLLGVILSRTVAGMELSATGANPRAASHGHVPVRGYITSALITSGALAALAGTNDVLSTKGVFQGEWNPSYGFVAFAVVFLGRKSVIGLIPAALVLGQLSYAADVVPRAADVAPAFFDVIEGALLVTLAVTVIVRSTTNRRFEIADRSEQ